jgi:4-hydroxybenzoate polyprenyltransferase
MQALLYSHIFLALCAVGMTAETIMAFELYDEKNTAYLFFIFFSTIITYNIKGISSLKEPHSEKLQWAVRNKKALLVFFVSSILLSTCLFIYINTKPLYYLIPLGLLSIAYSIPIGTGNYKISIRKIPYAKTILVAMVWTLVIAYFPFVIANASFSWQWLVSEFMFLFSLAILFDIKDMKTDALNSISTFPLTIGVRKTILLSFLFLLGGISFLFYSNTAHASLIAEIIISFVAIIFIIDLSKKSTEEKYYMFWIDGLMIGRFLLFILINTFVK